MTEQSSAASAGGPWTRMASAGGWLVCFLALQGFLATSSCSLALSCDDDDVFVDDDDSGFDDDVFSDDDDAFSNDDDVCEFDDDGDDDDDDGIIVSIGGVPLEEGAEAPFELVEYRALRTSAPGRWEVERVHSIVAPSLVDALGPGPHDELDYVGFALGAVRDNTELFALPASAGRFVQGHVEGEGASVVVVLEQAGARFESEPGWARFHFDGFGQLLEVELRAWVERGAESE